MTITSQQFEEQFGSAPQQDDLDRVNCPKVGEGGHSQCGVCKEHNKPRFMCGCTARVPKVHFWKNRSEAIGAANRKTQDTEEQHRATYVRGKGWLVKNAVTGTFFDSFGLPVSIEHR